MIMFLFGWRTHMGSKGSFSLLFQSPYGLKMVIYYDNVIFIILLIFTVNVVIFLFWGPSFLNNTHTVDSAQMAQLSLGSFCCFCRYLLFFEQTNRWKDELSDKNLPYMTPKMALER